MTSRNLKDSTSIATETDLGVVKLAPDGDDTAGLVVQADDARLAAAADLATHIADSSAAHAASAIAFTPAAGIAATNAQAAIEEVATDAASALTSGLSGKADASSVATALAGKQPIDADLTAIAGLTPSVDDIMQFKGSDWANRTPAQVKTDLALAKGDVGLGNVANLLHKLNATVDPVAGDDSGDGYGIGSYWINTTADTVWFCTDNTLGAAVWQDVTSVGGGSGGHEIRDDADSPLTQRTGLQIIVGASGATLTDDSGGDQTVLDLSAITGGGGSALTVQELDGTPSDSAVTAIIFPNGTLSIVGHVATYSPSSGGGGGADLSFLNATGDILYVAGAQPVTDQAQGRTILASSSSSSAPSAAIDNNTATYWSSVAGSGTPSYMDIDVATETTIDGAAIMGYGATYAPTLVHLEGSHDNITYTTVPGSSYAPATDGLLHSWTFTPITYRYWRLVVDTDNMSNAGSGVRQWSLYNTAIQTLAARNIGLDDMLATVIDDGTGNKVPGWRSNPGYGIDPTTAVGEIAYKDAVARSADYAAGATTTDSAHDGSQTGSLVVDGNDATYWSVVASGIPNHVTIDFGSVKLFDLVRVLLYDTPGMAYAPTLFELFASIDGINYTSLGRIAPTVQDDEYVLPLTLARYFRFRQLVTAGAVNTIQVFREASTRLVALPNPGAGTFTLQSINGVVQWV